MNEHHLQDDAPQLPNFFVRMAMILFQPAALFQALAARPAWFPMLAFASVATGASFLFLPGDVWTELARQGSPEATEAMGNLGATVMRSFAVVSVGTFMPFVPEGYLASVLGGMDLFSVWVAVVAGLGLSLLDERRRWAPTAAITVALMVVAPAMLTALPTLFR